jgi:hypothetical protein
MILVSLQSLAKSVSGFCSLRALSVHVPYTSLHTLLVIYFSVIRTTLTCSSEALCSPPRRAQLLVCATLLACLLLSHFPFPSRAATLVRKNNSSISCHFLVKAVGNGLFICIAVKSCMFRRIAVQSSLSRRIVP